MPILSSPKVLLSHRAAESALRMDEHDQKALHKELNKLNRLYNSYDAACRKADSIIGTMTTSPRKLVENMSVQLDKILEFEKISKFNLIHRTVVKLENYTQDEHFPDEPAFDEYDHSKLERYAEGWVQPLGESLYEQKRTIDLMLEQLPKAKPGLFSKLKTELLDMKGSDDSSEHDDDSRPKL